MNRLSAGIAVLAVAALPALANASGAAAPAAATTSSPATFPPYATPAPKAAPVPTAVATTAPASTFPPPAATSAPAASPTIATSSTPPATSDVTPLPVAISTSLVEDPAISQRAREWLLRLQADEIDRSQIDAKFNGLVSNAAFKAVSQQITSFGTLVAFTFLRSSRYPEGVVYEYAAHFATTPGTWYFAVDNEGKIGGMQILTKPQ